MNGESPAIEDIEIIERVLGGDRDAYAELVRRHEGKVRGLCVSLLSDRDEGEDAAQDAFIKAYRALGTFRRDAAFSTWIHRIALNRCRDLLRQRGRRKTESWDSLVEEGREDLAKLFDGGSGKVLEDRDLVDRVLSCLSPEERAVLLLREKEQLSYLEIADVLDCSLDAVKARLRRARQALNEKLRHFMERENVQ